MRPRDRVRRERGAVATVVAVLLVGGVLMGMLALSLDVGQVLVEKRQLQNSADAAALSLAASCWKDQSNCVATADSLATLVDNNANDRVSGIESVCKKNIPGGSLLDCGTSTGEWADCSPLPPALDAMNQDPDPTKRLPYVEVRTKTQTTNGAGRSDTMKNWVAGLLGEPTSAAGACSRAAVGATGDEAASDVPITFSGCDWQHATGGASGGGGGTYYPYAPVYNGANAVGYGGVGQPAWPAAAAAPPTQNPGGEVILLAQNPPGGATPASSCPNWNGHALPGGFGVLEPTSNVCSFVEYPHHWMHTSTGNNIGCNLDALVGKVVNLPIFDCTNTTAPGVAPPVNGCTTGTGNNAYYHRAGYASFYLSGYSLNVTGGIPNQRKSLVSGNFPCNGGNTCLSGWFLAGELSATSILAPPNNSGFGTWTAVPAG